MHSALYRSIPRFKIESGHLVHALARLNYQTIYTHQKHDGGALSWLLSPVTSRVAILRQPIGCERQLRWYVYKARWKLAVIAFLNGHRQVDSLKLSTFPSMKAEL